MVTANSQQVMLYRPSGEGELVYLNEGKSSKIGTFQSTDLADKLQTYTRALTSYIDADEDPEVTMGPVLELDDGSRVYSRGKVCPDMGFYASNPVDNVDKISELLPRIVGIQGEIYLGWSSKKINISYKSADGRRVATLSLKKPLLGKKKRTKLVLNSRLPPARHKELTDILSSL